MYFILHCYVCNKNTYMCVCTVNICIFLFKSGINVCMGGWELGEFRVLIFTVKTPFKNNKKYFTKKKLFYFIALIKVKAEADKGIKE